MRAVKTEPRFSLHVVPGSSAYNLLFSRTAEEGVSGSFDFAEDGFFFLFAVVYFLGRSVQVNPQVG